MKRHQGQLPPEIAAKLMTFLREENGEFQVADIQGLLNFVAEYGERHPALLELFKLNEEAVVEHFKRTGEVPPGVKVVHTTTREGDNVTKLEIFQGPLPPTS
jgi:hypothetical protein